MDSRTSTRAARRVPARRIDVLRRVVSHRTAFFIRNCSRRYSGDDVDNVGRKVFSVNCRWWSSITAEVNKAAHTESSPADGVRALFCGSGCCLKLAPATTLGERVDGGAYYYAAD